MTDKFARQASPAGRTASATVTDGAGAASSAAFDMFTRWLCEKCGTAGIDSWNKAAHDGLDFEGDYPNPMIWGDTCQCCCAPVVVAYSTPDAAPTAIFGAPDYSDENANIHRILADPTVGITLRPSLERDHDWSGGCTNLRPAPAINAQAKAFVEDITDEDLPF